jgi:arylsulfatase A-like enzyme
MITRRGFLGSVPALPALAQTGKRPNIVFVFSDDHAYQAISAYDGRLNRTPHIDRIAREGVRFDNALVTNSICAPSRAVVLTGKYSHLNGVIDNRQSFNGAQQTFPKLLRAAGYQTALFGKWHLQSQPTGFDAWEILPGQGSYYNPDFITPSGNRRRDGYVSDITTDLSLDWLDSRDKSRPFLLMCQHKAPHRNWCPSPDKLSMYEGVTFPEPDNLFDNYEHRATPARKQAMEIDRHMRLGMDLKLTGDAPDQQGPVNELKRMSDAQRRIWEAAYRRRNAEFHARKLQGRELVRWKYQRYMQDYLACISSVDDSVGRILNWLDATGEADNTVVVYNSDQGFYLGEHGWFDKRWIYEESIRSPMVARWPGVTRPGSVSKEMVANLDLAETFLDAAGLPVPPDMQGRSLAPVMRGQTPADWRRSFYYQYYEGGEHEVARHCGVRTDRYTLAHFYETDEWELFDREKDPRQMRSVYGDAAYAPEVKRLKAELARLRRELKVPDVDPDRQKG